MQYRTLLKSGRGAPARLRVVIRILVVGGTQVYREALGAALEMPGRFTVIGIASSGDQAIGLLHDWNPDAVLIDLPRAEGLAASHSLFLSDPQIIVIPLNLPPDEEEIVAWAEAGAAAFLLQDGSLDDLRAVIEGAVRGSSGAHPRWSRALCAGSGRSRRGGR